MTSREDKLWPTPVLWNGNRAQFFRGNRERLRSGGWDFLMLSRHFDEIQLDGRLQHVFPHMLAHLGRAGFEPTQQVTWHQQGNKELAPGMQYMPCGLNLPMAPANVRDSEEFQMWDEVLRQAAQKRAFVTWAKNNGLIGLMPETLPFDANELPVIPPDFGLGWVKDAESEVTGKTNVHGPFEGEQLMAAAVDFSGEGLAYQVQQHVDGVDISNQYLVVRKDGESTLHFLGTTEQVVHEEEDGAHHAGNRWRPAVGDCGWMTHAIAQKLVAQGLQGFFGIDARVDGLTGRVTEPNLRTNGSSAALALGLMNGFDDGLLIRESPVNPNLSLDQLFGRIERSGLEFRPVIGGVIVHTIGYVEQGTLGLTAYGPDAQDMFDEMSAILNR